MADSGGTEFYWSNHAGELVGRRLRGATPLRLSMVRIFRHYVPVQLLLLALAEACVLFSAIYVGAAIRFDAQAFEKIRPIWPQGAVFTVVIMASMIAMGLYKRETPAYSWLYYAKFSAAFLVGWVGMALVFYVYPPMFLGRGVFGIAFLVGVSGTLLLRLLFFRVADQKALLRRVLVLGTGSRAAGVERDGQRRPRN